MAVLIGSSARRGAVAAALALVATCLAPPAWAATRIGDRAPDFELPDASGRSVALASARGRIAIVDFWASWCVACAPMLTVLDTLARRHDGRVRVFAVDIDQSRDKAEAFLREHLPDPSPFTTVLADPGGAVLARYGASGMPALFVVGPDGRTALVEVGYSPEHARAVEDAVRALLPDVDAGGAPP